MSGENDHGEPGAASQQPAKEPVLTRWPIYVRDWVGSDTLRAMSAESEDLFLRLCIDQWEHGAARADMAHWRKAHGHRFHDFESAWSEAEALFEKTPDGLGLVHPRVTVDRARATSEIAAKIAGARRMHAQRKETTCSANANHVQTGFSASASVSASASASSSVPPPAETPLPEGGAAQARPTRQPRRTTTGAHHEAIRLWDEIWSKIQGEPYAWNARETSAVARALKLARGDVEAFGARARRLLEDPPDDWYRQNASPSLLADRWNQLSVRVARNGRRAPTMDERNREKLREMAAWSENPT